MKNICHCNWWGFQLGVITCLIMFWLLKLWKVESCGQNCGFPQWCLINCELLHGNPSQIGVIILFFFANLVCVYVSMNKDMSQKGKMRFAWSKSMRWVCGPFLCLKSEINWITEICLGMSEGQSLMRLIFHLFSHNREWDFFFIIHLFFTFI